MEFNMANNFDKAWYEVMRMVDLYYPINFAETIEFSRLKAQYHLTEYQCDQLLNKADEYYKARQAVTA